MHDTIVIGGGPSGTTAATLLARKGHSVLLLEREQFPRFQIGESLLPYNNDLLRELGVMEAVSARATFPKHGAEFVTGDEKIRYVFRFAENLPEQYARSFQASRSEFDHILLRNARGNGVDVREQMLVTDVDLSRPERVIVSGTSTDGEKFSHEGRFLIDASGHGAFVGSRLGSRRDEPLLKKISIFGHYRGLSGRGEGLDAGNTVIVILRDAWFWSIPLDAEHTSVGLVVDRDFVKNGSLNPQQILELTIRGTPYMAGRMKSAELVGPVRTRKDFSYRMKHVVGPNYCLVGDAAGFFDPIFSTGVFMGMKTAQLASEALHAKLSTGDERLFARYDRSLKRAMKRYFAFISRFYRREFLEVFLNPQARFGLLPVIVSLLAGDVFEKKSGRWRLMLFFALAQIQKRRPVIAPSIGWDALPRAVGSKVAEESFV
ncbi:MAG: NAD(P)/FAD-dependent oxidoreductase [Acidobacteriota bacterium]